MRLRRTRNLWIQIYDMLEKFGFEVFLSNPGKTRLIAEAKNKTDKVDAKILARLLRADMLFTCYVPGEEIRNARAPPGRVWRRESVSRGRGLTSDVWVKGTSAYLDFWFSVLIMPVSTMLDSKGSTIDIPSGGTSRRRWGLSPMR